MSDLASRILVVDDEVSITEFVGYALRKEGYDVDVFADGEEALAAARKNHYDLFILDIMLPGMDGYELCRRIRNILSHNVEDNGEPVVEPSEGTLRRMEEILAFVKHPVMAIDYGTPADKILFAHPNDLALNVMRHMVKNGYSHVPVAEQGRLIGGFSSDSLMQFSAKKGLSQVRDELRIGEMKDAIGFGDKKDARFMFLPEDATLPAVREAFEKRRERNHRLAVVFLTEDGTWRTPVKALLTSWDALR